MASTQLHTQTNGSVSVAVADPMYARPPRRKRFNLEKAGWMYMRISGVVLVVLIFGHLYVNLMEGDGIRAVDFGFVAGKYASPFWKIWDGLMLWLALIHGANGMRTIVNDYVTRRGPRRVALGAILVSTIILIVLGTYVILAFDPCLANPDGSTWAGVCNG